MNQSVTPCVFRLGLHVAEASLPSTAVPFSFPLFWKSYFVFRILVLKMQNNIGLLTGKVANTGLTRREDGCV